MTKTYADNGFAGTEYHNGWKSETKYGTIYISKGNPYLGHVASAPGYEWEGGNVYGSSKEEALRRFVELCEKGEVFQCQNFCCGEEPKKIELV